MKKIMAVMVAFLILFSQCSYVYAQEQITLSTYYPAPYGEYRTLAIGDGPPYTAPDPTATPIDLIVQGDVGIGTPTPAAKLDITDTATPELLLQTSATSSQDAILTIRGGRGTSATSQIGQIRFENNAGGGFEGARISMFNSDTVTATSNADLTFYTDTGSALTEKMRIIDNGNVGIGTADPDQKLSLRDGQIYLGHGSANQFESGRIRFAEYDGTSYQGAFVHYDGNDNILNIGVHNTNDETTGNDNNAISILRTNGNVGIGTTSPAYALDVGGFIHTRTSPNSLIKIDADLTGNPYLEFAQNDIGRAQIQYIDSTDTLQIRNGGNPGNLGIAVATDGNVGVGTVPGAAQLGVVGGGPSYAIYADGSFSDGTIFGHNTGSGSGHFSGVFGRSNSAGSRGVYGMSDHGVGVYGYTSDGFAGYFDGDVTITGELRHSETVHTGWDIAEYIKASDPGIGPGDVVIADPTQKESIMKENKQYQTSVLGIISTEPGDLGGFLKHKDGKLYSKEEMQKQGFRALTIAGRVPCKVTTENGPIKPGDILVTSSKPGYAMKADLDKLKIGMMLGKALESLDEGEGKIIALVK